VAETLNAAGYSILNPVSHQITGMSSDGWHQLTFDAWEATRAHLAAHGGLVTFWQDRDELDCRDIGLAFAPNDREISLSVLHDLRPERQDDVQVAADLRTLFIALCDRLDSVYGYSTDEYRLEAAFPDGDIRNVISDLRTAVKMLAPLPILFWINYLSKAYLSQIPKSSFAGVSFREQVTDQGIYVYLSKHPWDARIARHQPNGQYRLV